jgi:hypothetical protein
MDPLMSSRKTMRRGRVPWRAHLRLTGSPCAASDARTHGAPHVGTRSLCGAHPALRLARRTGHAQLLHPSLGETHLVVGVPGEVLLAQRLDAGEPQGDGGFVPGLRRPVGGAVLLRVHRDGDAQFLRGRALGGFAVLPEHGERAVEHGDVLGGAGERAAGGPVDAVAVLDADETQRVDEREHGVERCGDVDAAQHPRERHGERLCRRLRDERAAHLSRAVPRARTPA